MRYFEFKISLELARQQHLKIESVRSKRPVLNLCIPSLCVKYREISPRNLIADPVSSASSLKPSLYYAGLRIDKYSEGPIRFGHVVVAVLDLRDHFRGREMLHGICQ